MKGTLTLGDYTPRVFFAQLPSDTGRTGGIDQFLPVEIFEDP
jgi:hypothetical protein